MTLSRLWSPCIFRHGDTLRERDAQGQMILVCSDCYRVIRVLESAPIIMGPAHRLTPDLGARTTKARVVKGDNVREWRRSQR